MKFGFVDAPWWDDKPVVIAANGPSEEGFDYNLLRGQCYLLAVKGKMLTIPWADAGTGIDIPRYKEWSDRIAKLPFPVYWGANVGREIIPTANTIVLDRVHEITLSRSPGAIAIGGNSGYASINVATLKRAKEIYLVGFDYQSTTDKWHTNEYDYLRHRSQRPRIWQGWARKFNELSIELKKLRVNVINASPDSMITAFPKITLDEMVSILT